jgi:transglutaminase-like putative cysteine protease
VAAPGRLRAVETSPEVAVVQAGRRTLLLTAAAPLSPAPDDEVEVDPAGRRLGFAIDPDLLEAPPVDSYRVRWAPRPDVADTGLRAAPETSADLDGGSFWTFLPDEVPQRVRDLAVRLTRDAGDRLEAARAVEAYVRGVAEYTLDGPPLPDGADAADDLLFGSRQGFCEQFATAEAVLLRAVGIPARIATGYAGGEVRGDRRVLRAKDAHAWVEVLVPGLGWVSSDPTAGSRPATPPQDRLLALLRDPRFWLALGAVLLAVLLTVVVRRRRRRRPAAAPGPRTPAERLLAAYALSQRALEPAGLARGPTQTLADHAAAVVALLEVAGGPPPAHEVDAALADVARLLYGSVPPDDAAADRGARALSALAAAVPRLVDDALTALGPRTE